MDLLPWIAVVALSLVVIGLLVRREQGQAPELGAMQETLRLVEHQLRAAVLDRTRAETELLHEVRSVTHATAGLRQETTNLVTALRKPHARGRWGEMQLKRVVELAGMVEHTDFSEQRSFSSDEGLQRPDMVIHLAGDRSLVVDAKVPLSAFLEAHEATDPQLHAERLRAHARQLRTHVDTLASKAYWSRLAESPELVVLFVPGESFLSAALEADPALLDDAFSKRVVIASPNTLMALLRTVALGWAQESLARDAAAIRDLGRELHDRLAKMGADLDKLGRGLRSAVGAYNDAMGSLEGRVLVTARRFRDMKVTDKELPTPGEVETGVRRLTAPELAAGGLTVHHGGDAA